MEERVRRAQSAFVETYIRPERRERLGYELSHPQKRGRGLDRFCHRSADLLDPKRIFLWGRDLMRQEAFLRFAAQHPEECVILSPDAVLDGQVLPLADALSLCLLCLDASIIVGDGFAVVREEAYTGGTAQYLLLAPGRQER